MNARNRGPGTLRRYSALVAIGALVFGACGSKGEQLPPYETVPAPVDTTAVPTSTALPGETTSTLQPNVTLTEVCDSPVVIQLDSTMDMWAMPYIHLIGASDTGTVSANSSRYRAPLVNRNGSLTGVDIELRTSARLPSSGVTADVILKSADVLFAVTDVTTVLPPEDSQFTVVAAPWSRTDIALEWNATSSSMRTIGDIAGSSITNPTFDQAASNYLEGSGLLPNPNKAGAVRDDVENVPKGAAASLTRLLDTDSGVKPGEVGLRRQLLADVGWEPYPHVLTTSQANAKDKKDCIRAVVPLVQYATLRASVEPRATAKRLVGMVERMGLTTDGEAIANRFTRAMNLGMLNVGSVGAPIAADPSVARIIQIAKAQKTSAAVSGTKLKIPKGQAELDKQFGRFVDRSFIDSDIKFTVRNKPGFLEGDI